MVVGCLIKDWRGWKARLTTWFLLALVRIDPQCFLGVWLEWSDYISKVSCLARLSLS